MPAFYESVALGHPLVALVLANHTMMKSLLVGLLLVALVAGGEVSQEPLQPKQPNNEAKQVKKEPAERPEPAAAAKEEGQVL